MFFLELSCFFDDPVDAGNLISDSSDFSKTRMISVRFQGKPFNIMVIEVYALTSNAEEADVERFYQDLRDILELTPKKGILFIIGHWNAKVGSQEISGVTANLALECKMKQGKG